MHESTISRVTTSKYMLTRGVFELKIFLLEPVAADGKACSATAIRSMLKNYGQGRIAIQTISDSKIAEVLSRQGIHVARRRDRQVPRAHEDIPPVSESHSFSSAENTMHITVTGQQVDDHRAATPSRASEEVGRIQKPPTTLTPTNVVLHVQKTRHIAEATIHARACNCTPTPGRGHVRRDPDALADKLDRQVLKHKEVASGRKALRHARRRHC